MIKSEQFGPAQFLPEGMLSQTHRLSHYTPPAPRQPRQSMPRAGGPRPRPRTPKQEVGMGSGSTPLDNASMMMYMQSNLAGSPSAMGSSGAGGEKYSCAKCGKTFKEKYHFFGHMNSHLNVRPYTCKKCGKGFSYSNNLSRHKRTCGAAEEGEKCDICQQRFGSVNALQMHLLQAHGSTY